MVDVQKISDDAYEIINDDQRLALNVQDLGRLETLLADILRPKIKADRSHKYQQFLNNLGNANNAGIQALLRTATHEDILVLLHSSENDMPLKKKLYGNMTENSVKIYVEDILFQFREGVPAYRFDEAMIRLIATVETLVKDGALKLDKGG
jgi:hypothetical protein